MVDLTKYPDTPKDLKEAADAILDLKLLVEQTDKKLTKSNEELVKTKETLKTELAKSTKKPKSTPPTDTKDWKSLYEKEKKNNEEHVCLPTNPEPKEKSESNMLEILRERNEKLVNENGEYIRMYNELRPSLARANLKVEDLEEKLATYQQKLAQIEVPSK